MKRVSTYMLIPKKTAGFPSWPGGMSLFLFASFLVHAQERAVQPVPGAGVLADGKHFTYNQI